MWLRRRFQEWIASKWIETYQDNLQIGTAKTVARLMSFAKINCSQIRLFILWSVYALRAALNEK